MLKIPKGYDSVTKTFRLPVDLIEEMEKLAHNNKISLIQVSYSVFVICNEEY